MKAGLTRESPATGSLRAKNRFSVFSSPGGVSRPSVIQYIFILPAALWILSFTIVPLISAVNYTFADYVLGRGITRYVGFTNYINVLWSGAFWYSLFITVIYVSIAVPLELVLGFLLAWFVTLCPREHNFFRPILTAPLFTMEVAIGYLGITLFTSQGGLFAEVLSYLGLNVPRMTSSYGGLAASIILDIWRWTPFVFLIATAGLSAIPDQLYEAALLETSDYRQLMLNIALPLSWPVLSVAFLLRLIEGMKTFGLPLALTGGGPGISTQLFSILNYYTTIQFFDFGKGSTMAIIYLIIISIAISFIFNGLRKSFD
jgi:multiple sugar transport system permease protein